MDELTIKQKAKRYDELKVTAQELEHDGWIEKITLFDLFPELKESEDERIRKFIIHLLDNHVSNQVSRKDIKECITWLEKQGEHSVSPLFTFDDVLTIQCAMAYVKFQDRELDVALKKLYDKVYDAYHDSKPIFDAEIPFGAKDSELEEVFYSIPNGFHAEIEDDKVVIKKGKQKSWSTEDEAKLKNIVAFLKSPSLCAMDSSKSIINENIKYLKFLKYRIQSKPESSNEHYELEEFAKIVRCNLTGISKAVQKLFESKYIELTGKEMYGGLKD